MFENSGILGLAKLFKILLLKNKKIKTFIFPFMYFELYCVPVNDGFPYNVSTVVPRVFGEPLRALPLRKDRRFHEAAAEEAQRKFATVRESSDYEGTSISCSSLLLLQCWLQSLLLLLQLLSDVHFYNFSSSASAANLQSAFKNVWKEK